MSSSAAETVANIEELLRQILLSVPPRSLVRFKCVSKRWLSLISEPGFCGRSATLRKPKISGFFSSKTEDNTFKAIPLGKRDKIPSGQNPFKAIHDSLGDGSARLKIIQSCNGLFLCLRYSCDSSRSNRSRYVADHAVYVVNPTTNQFLVLSSPRVEQMARVNQLFVRYALAFDPSKSPHYKVVCVSNSHLGNYLGYPYQIDIYSSETRKWKKRHNDLHQKRAMHFDSSSREGAVYCNGAVHWIRCIDSIPCCYLRDGRFVRDAGDVLHYYDIAKGSLRLVAATPPVPVSVKTKYQGLVRRYFGEAGGRLYLIESYTHYDTQCEVMEMGKDYSGWFLKYHVDLNPVIAALLGRLLLSCALIERRRRRKKIIFCCIFLVSGFKEDGNHPYMETLACV
ncbi:hypothetical protein M0R45_025503 [Rubus argutus]|uniref:F-box domain-containing protein n=1 Tax=Rubus argutus TaxID=59490 RepID=A0AAW1WYD8_RUBAR